jgi:hypothetical protein
VNIPELRSMQNYPFSFVTDHIRGLAAQLHVPFLDLLPVFSQQNERSLWVTADDPHMNTRAHALAADAVHAMMKREHLLQTPGAGRARDRSVHPGHGAAAYP